MSKRADLPDLKLLPSGEMATALAMAQRCRDVGEPEEAESICLDVLESESGNQEARVLLLLARTDLLDRGLPSGVERAREALSKLTGDYERAYYAGIVCERQARYLLRARGRRSSFVAWDWFRYAMEHFEEAIEHAPDRVEAVLRFNTCIRLIQGNRHCVPSPDEDEAPGIE
jgi:hypothetical protein